MSSPFRIRLYPAFTMSRDLTEHAVTHMMRMAQRYPELGIPNQVRGTVVAYDVTED